MSRQLMLAAVAVTALGCHSSARQESSPLSPDGATGTPVLLAPAASEASRAPGFRVKPAPDGQQRVSLPVGGQLSINAASLRELVSPRSRLRVDWGDGSVGGADCGSCRVEHVYGTAGSYEATATLGEVVDGGGARTERWRVIVEGAPRLFIRIRDVVVDRNPAPPEEGMFEIRFHIESTGSYPVTWWATLFDGPNAVGSGVPRGGGDAVCWVGRYKADPLRVTLTAYDEHGLEAEPVVLLIPW